MELCFYWTSVEIHTITTDHSNAKQYLDLCCIAHYWEWLAVSKTNRVSCFTALSQHWTNFLFRLETTFSIFCVIENKCFDFFETCRGTAREHVSLTLPIAILLQNLLGKGKHVEFGALYKALYLSSTISNNIALRKVRKRLLGYTQFALCFFHIRICSN